MGCVKLHADEKAARLSLVARGPDAVIAEPAIGSTAGLRPSKCSLDQTIGDAVSGHLLWGDVRSIEPHCTGTSLAFGLCPGAPEIGTGPETEIVTASRRPKVK